MMRVLYCIYVGPICPIFFISGTYRTECKLNWRNSIKRNIRNNPVSKYFVADKIIRDRKFEWDKHIRVGMHVALLYMHLKA